jgi:hypothetical protein
MNKKVKAERRPARNATLNENLAKPLIEMDSDEILNTFGHSVAGGEAQKNKPMKVSGKSVFSLAKIIGNKSRKCST